MAFDYVTYVKREECEEDNPLQLDSSSSVLVHPTETDSMPPCSSIQRTGVRREAGGTFEGGMYLEVAYLLEFRFHVLRIPT